MGGGVPYITLSGRTGIIFNEGETVARVIQLDESLYVFLPFMLHDLSHMLSGGS